MIIRTVSLLACLLFASAATAQNWRDDDLGQRITKGVADSVSLWLLGETGAVVRFDRTTGQRVVVAQTVIDILEDGPALWVLSMDEGRAVALQNLRSDELPEVIGVTGTPIGLFHTDEGVGFLTTEMVLIPAGEDWRRQILAAALPRWGDVARAGAGALYLGVNRGEWGGGLRRIDMATGAIAFVTQHEEGLCAGLFNPNCDPIVGVFQDRRRPDCVIAGAGLAHMGLGLGLVARVCGDRITPVFSAPRPTIGELFPFPGQDWPFHSLTETPDGWLAVSDGRYFRSRGGDVEERPLPDLHEWSGLRISRPDDGVLFIMSACCWGSITDPTLHDVLAIPIR